MVLSQGLPVLQLPMSIMRSMALMNARWTSYMWILALASPKTSAIYYSRKAHS